MVSAASIFQTPGNTPPPYGHLLPMQANTRLLTRHNSPSSHQQSSGCTQSFINRRTCQHIHRSTPCLCTSSTKKSPCQPLIGQRQNLELQLNHTALLSQLCNLVSSCSAYLVNVGHGISWHTDTAVKLQTKWPMSGQQ